MPKPTQVEFKILRFNPERDRQPHYQVFRLDHRTGLTILDGLNQIKWFQDGTLTYRMSCRSAICGSCAMFINGRSRLACKTQLDPLLGRDGEVVVEPMRHMRVIKDLVVEMTPFWRKIEQRRPWLIPDSSQPEPEKERLMSKVQFNVIRDDSTCIMCASCYSACSVLDVDAEFVGPAALAKGYRFVGDSRDGATLERLQEMSSSHGMWDCTHCFLCIEACPKEVNPMEPIMALRTEALSRGLVHNNGARHARAFVASVRASGRLNEVTLPMKSLSPLDLKGLIKLLPVGVRMVLRGKMPSLRHRAIPRVDEVQRLHKALERR